MWGGWGSGGGNKGNTGNNTAAQAAQDAQAHAQAAQVVGYNRMAAQAEAEWRSGVTTQLRDISKEVQDLALTLQSLSASMMTRKEIEDADNRRVSVDTYTSDMAAVHARIARLEGSAARIMPWIALAISSLLGVIGTAIGVIGMIHNLTK